MTALRKHLGADASTAVPETEGVKNMHSKKRKGIFHLKMPKLSMFQKALSSELVQLDRQIPALLRKQDKLLQQKLQLEAAREVCPSDVAPASSLRTPGDAVLTPAPAPPGPWERQRRRRPSRPSPPSTNSPPSLHRLRLGLRRLPQRLGAPHRI
ncbi:hypothetical protein MHYP_G00131070, partial [Metynnis hypsauchen]